MKKSLRIRVKEIKGKCALYKEGDQFFIEEGYILKTTIPLCMHGLMAIVPYYVALSRGILPKELGLGNEKKRMFSV